MTTAATLTTQTATFLSTWKVWGFYSSGPLPPRGDRQRIQNPLGNAKGRRNRVLCEPEIPRLPHVSHKQNKDKRCKIDSTCGHNLPRRNDAKGNAICLSIKNYN